ncbi:ABC transporter ATP-binding protein [bacterium]|nr:ABC transporter ATP-binding protein [bacterium]
MGGGLRLSLHRNSNGAGADIETAPSAIANDGRRKTLEIRGLETHFFLEEGLLEAVRGVDLTLYEEEMVALVGESGCGKSVTAMSVLGLMSESRARIVAGEVWYFDAEGNAVNLVRMNQTGLSRIRGKEIAMIFQDPLTSLNPVITVGEQIAEVVRRHTRASGAAARARSAELLETVGLPDPRSKLRSYPHELSGGMRQRVMIAIALALNPRLLIADEPTTALDVTIQAQILELLAKLQDDFKTSILLITHDLGVVAQTCSFVNVMYAGRIVESCPVETFFDNPLHPYSKGLLHSLPRIDRTQKELRPIPGQPPDLIGLEDGCPFAPRCPLVTDLCRKEYPPISGEESHRVSCFHAGE